MMPFVVGLLIKLTVILAAGLVATAALRRASPALRHLVLLATIVCGLTLPLAMVISPSWEVAILPRSTSLSSPNAIAGTNSAQNHPNQKLDASSSEKLAVAPAPGAAGPSLGSDSQGASIASAAWRRAPIILLGWTLGFVLIVTWLVIGRIRLRRIAREAWPLDAEWQRTLAAACEEAGVTSDVGLLSSPVVTTPLTWGSITPVILLPEDAPDWPEDHRRVVLRHELAHVARRDSLAQLVAGFVCALYWFHPLVWMSERRLRAECERACDDRVVSLGTSPTEYASHLLEVARSARAFGAPGFLSVAMARPSQLEGRLLAVLNDSPRRVAASRGARVTALLLAIFVVLPLAAFRPVTKKLQTIHARPATLEQPRIVENAPRLSYPPDVVSSAKKTLASNSSGLDSTFQLSAPVRSGGTLELELKTGGEITISGWDRAEVVVRARLGGRDWRLTRVTLQPSDGNATLESSFITNTRNQSTSHDFDIEVPRNFNVRLNSSGGGISITGVDGTFTGHTGGGEVTIKKANGEVHISTGGGEVYVADSRLNGSVTTGGGMIRIVSVQGNVVGTSGSGPVIYTNSPDPKHLGMGIGASKSASASIAGPEASASVSARSSASTVTSDDDTGRTTTTRVENDFGKGYGYGAGAIRMISAGGSLSLPSAPDGARVITGGGSISIGSSGGEVYAQTGGGPIDIGPSTGSVAAITGAGDINVELKGSGSHSVDVASGKGQVVLVLPRDFNGIFDIETAYTNNFDHKTRIVSDWPLTITETNEWDSSQGTPRKYVRARQTIGTGGGVIRIRTVNGNIVLRRGS